MFSRPGEKPFERGARNVYAPRVNEAGVCAFLTDKSAIWLCGVHWRTTERRSVPCTGNAECEGCKESSAIMKAYAPVLLYRGYLERTETGYRVPNLPSHFNAALWTPRTLEITKSIADLIEAAKPGLMVLIERPGSRPNSRCSARQLVNKLNVPGSLAWDVRTSLSRTWMSRSDTHMSPV